MSWARCGAVRRTMGPVYKKHIRREPGTPPLWWPAGRRGSAGRSARLPARRSKSLPSVATRRERGVPLAAPASALTAPQDPCLRRCGKVQPAPGAKTACPSGSQVLQRLQRKRAAVEKEVSRVPGAPKTSKDVFQLCRGFERAFSYTVDVSCLPPTSRLPNGCPCFGTAARPAVRPGPALRRGLLVVYRHGRPNAHALCATWPGPHRRTRRDRRRAGARSRRTTRGTSGARSRRRACRAPCSGCPWSATSSWTTSRRRAPDPATLAPARRAWVSRSGRAGRCLTGAEAAAVPARAHRPVRPGL